MPPVIKFAHNLKNAESRMDTYISIAASTTKIKNKQALADNIKDYLQGPPNSRYSPQQIEENIKEFTRIYQEKYALSEAGKYKVKSPAGSDINVFGLTVDKDKVGKSISNAISGFDPKTFYQLMEDDNAMNLDDTLAKSVITPEGGDSSKAADIADSDPVAEEQEKIAEKQEELKDLAEAAKEGSKFLENISLPYYVDDDYNTELGIIGNIYVNVKMLYDLAIDANVEAQDKKEKKEIALYDFIKNILSRISPVIGNVNNFDVLTDEKNNAKIIDINLVTKEDPETLYNNAFELQLHNLNSIVRSYKLESKIFPEQSTVVAIGAQVEGGALGVDTTTFVAFNRSIRDRIIPVKSAPADDLTASNTAKEKVEALLSNLEILYKFFGELKPGFFTDADFDVDKAGNYQNALKDLINYMRSIVSSKTNNKAILPTTLSIEMDGLGGLIIGNLFKINTDILPRGYKGSGQGGVGPNVGYVITGLGHTVGSGDWITKIDAQTIILDPPQSEIENFDYSTININVAATSEKEVIQKDTGVGGTPLPKKTNTGGTKQKFNGKTYNNGEVDELLVRMDITLENAHKTAVCQSDGARVRLQANAMKNLEQMIKDAKVAGIHLGINSAYRTKADQDRVWLSNCSNAVGSGKCKAKNGKQPAATPGNSNHGFGLAVDLANAGGTRINPNTTPKEWKWIQANKHKYSFENINNTNESHHYNFYG